MQVSIKTADSIWQRVVKERDGYKCQYCGRMEGLNVHHIFSRSKRSTRWYAPNGVTLCNTHHTLSSGFSAHKTPAEFIDWLQKWMGEEKYSELRRKAHEIEKRKIDDIMVDLTH